MRTFSREEWLGVAHFIGQDKLIVSTLVIFVVVLPLLALILHQF